MRSLIACAVRCCSLRLFRWLYPLVLLGAAPAFAQGTVADVLDEVNRQRQSMGLYPLVRDPAMTAKAMSDASWRAHRGISGHMGDIGGGGRAEGVGMRSGRDPYGRNFLTCFHSPGGGGIRGRFRRGGGGGSDYTRSHRYAGAAAAVSPRGTTYYTLILR